MGQESARHSEQAMALMLELAQAPHSEKRSAPSSEQATAPILGSDQDNRTEQT